MKVIQLPQRLKLTLSLDEALSQRRTKRDCKNEPLADDVLATLLWSCAGITDKEGRRTVPSARDFRALSAYVLRSDGAWRFNAESNTLEQTTEKDVRESSTTHQPEYVTRAPVSIIFVADHKKGEALPATTLAVDAGTMGQSCYLAATSLGLAGCIRASIDHDKLRAAMNLPSHLEPLLAFTVGYPQ